jgi:uncharacterized membrane protein YeaQ/YmgE (transglycosylase-associated protein family)
VSAIWGAFLRVSGTSADLAPGLLFGPPAPAAAGAPVRVNDSEVIVGLLWFLLFGLFVGFLARAILPGRQSMGLIMTSALGMVGSLLGGFLGSMISHEEVTHVHSAGLIGSIIGALLVLALVSMGSRRRSLL